MTRVLVAALVALALSATAFAGKANYSCSVSPASATLAYPDRTGWYLTATVPAKATVNAIVTGAGAPSNEWTNFGTAKQGNVATISDVFATTLFTTTGVATVQLVDVHKDGSYTEITSCSFAVT
jgi:hypothetical protein